MKGAIATLAAAFVVAGCNVTPLRPFGTETPPLALMPLTLAGGEDRRARFREIYCAVLEERAAELPDMRSCDEALTRVGTEPPASPKPVDLGRSKRGLVAAIVPGVGFACIVQWLEPQSTVAGHVQRFGFDAVLLQVDALSGTATNARQIRDALTGMPAQPGAPRVVLVGYSKGAPDVLEAVVAYPEIRSRVAAVVSLAGAVGGSPLANDAEQYQAELLRHFPGATCDAGDGGAVASLRPDVRQAWLANHELPSGLRYYSLVTYPQPERMSQLLQHSYRKLSMLDGRNDSQMIFYDQVIPGSALLGYLNADHWAVAVPIARTRTTVSSIFVTRNDYPREALLEAVLRFVEEDLGR